MTQAKVQLAIARAIQARQEFGFGTTSPIDIFGALQQEEKYTFVFLPLDGQIAGFSNRHKGHFIIIINSKDNEGRKNFTCAHELYHLLFEYDDNDNYIKSVDSEIMANVFASYFLIPEDALYLFLGTNNLLKKSKITINDIIKVERYFGVSRLAILIRLKDRGLITQEQFEEFSQNVISSVRNAGGDVNKYIDGEPIKITKGEYIKIAKQLLESGKISRGKYEEYMIDAFNIEEIFGGLGDE